MSTAAVNIMKQNQTKVPMNQTLSKNTFALYQKYRNIILYGVIGCSGVLIDMIIYSLLLSFNVHYQLANIISVNAGIINNFCWNAKINYKVQENHLIKFIRFYSVGLCGWGLSALLLYIFKEQLFLPDKINLLISGYITWFHWGEQVVKGIVIIGVVFVQFLINHYYSFRKG